MGEDAVILDKRPVRPKRRRAKKRSKKTAKKVAPEQKLQEDAAEVIHETTPSSQPQIIEDGDPEAPKAVTFFSRFKMDELLIEQARHVQLGTNKFTTLPARIVRFSNHFFTTEDEKIIDYIRNPNGAYEKFDRFGRDVFEVGKPEHEAPIHRYSDAGIEEYLIELHTKGRKIAKAEGFAFESSA